MVSTLGQKWGASHLLSNIPHFDAAISTTSHHFWRTPADPEAATSIDTVHNGFVGFGVVDRRPHPFKIPHRKRLRVIPRTVLPVSARTPTLSHTCTLSLTYSHPYAPL